MRRRTGEGDSTRRFSTNIAPEGWAKSVGENPFGDRAVVWQQMIAARCIAARTAVGIAAMAADDMHLWIKGKHYGEPIRCLRKAARPHQGLCLDSSAAHGRSNGRTSPGAGARRYQASKRFGAMVFFFRAK